MGTADFSLLASGPIVDNITISYLRDLSSTDNIATDETEETTDQTEETTDGTEETTDQTEETTDQTEETTDQTEEETI